ncbi:MAG TPA: hypothetical protein VHL80_16045 [Polyangia bacterium]|nr:hypothetical protein [Polyangia bacterium]
MKPAPENETKASAGSPDGARRHVGDGVASQVDGGAVPREEGEVADPRAEPVGTHDEIERVVGASIGPDPHRGPRGVELDGRAPEDHRDAAFERREENALEIAPHEVEVPAPEHAAPKTRVAEVGARPAGLVDEHEVPGRPVDLGEPRQEPQTLGDVVARTEEVEHEALSPERLRALHEHDVHAEPLELERRGDPGDSRSDDEDAHGACPGCRFRSTA